MPEITDQPVVFRKETGHEATARPVCATCFRFIGSRNATPCRSMRPCSVEKCENLASMWIIDTE